MLEIKYHENAVNFKSDTNDLNNSYIAIVDIFIRREIPGGIELVFHTENSMKYRSLHTILKYRFKIPNLIFHVQNISISYRNGMLKRYLRIVCSDRYFILFSV
jgi:hypothetical protein